MAATEKVGNPADDVPAPRAVRRVALLVAYDGTPFHGFAVNDGVPTVAGALTAALEQVTNHPVHLVGAGRTDAGVHAWGQVVSVDVPASTDVANLPRALTALCRPAIVVRDVWIVRDDFSARFDALWRHYRYTILNTAIPDPFRANTSWHVRAPLDLRALRLASDPLIGERDFSAFCRKPDPDDVPAGTTPSMKRYVHLAAWSEPEPGIVRFEIRANAFCHQMVRSIVGTLVDIGVGRRHASDVMMLIRSGERREASPVAPPNGLCLWEVGYPHGTFPG